jgi:hypothetical protein
LDLRESDERTLHEYERLPATLPYKKLISAEGTDDCFFDPDEYERLRKQYNK